MCEFCHQHGEGKKWYLQAKNYSEDLLSDMRRRKFIADFMAHPEHLDKGEEQLGKLDLAPAFVRAALTPYISNRQKKIHFGQVVPVEEVERIFGFVNSIVRMACICRMTTVGTEQRYCYGVSMAPQGGRLVEILRGVDASYLTGPQTGGLEVLSKDEALHSLHEHEREGLCHTVWTFITPYIGGICNCDRSDCQAMRATVVHGMPVMFRAEYVASVDPELCSGCRQCMRLCQFGAISYSIANKKAVIDRGRCYGCGICRSGCVKSAITLLDRNTVPEVAKRW